MSVVFLITCSYYSRHAHTASFTNKILSLSLWDYGIMPQVHYTRFLEELIYYYYKGATILNKSLLTVLLQFVRGRPGPLLNPGSSQYHGHQ